MAGNTLHMARQSAPAYPVLVTRPQAEGEAFAAALTKRFGAHVQPLVSPLLSPRNLKPDLPPRSYAAVVFTSAQAVNAARSYRPVLPAQAWCVGRKTARAATDAGFQANSADGDVEALLRALAKDPPDGSILYLRGVDTAGNLLERLTEMGLMVDEAVVYAQDPVPLNKDATALLQTQVDLIVPLFSPRTAQLFRAGLPAEISARLHIAAMSRAVAEALGDLHDAKLVVAHQPDAGAMMDAVERLLVGLSPP